MSKLTEEQLKGRVADAPPAYHAPVLVDYGNARNMTRTSRFQVATDGGFADEVGPFGDDGAGPASS